MQFVSLNDMPEEFQNMVKKQYLETTSNVKPYGVMYKEASQSLGNAMTQLGAAMSILDEAQSIDDLNISSKLMSSGIRKLESILENLNAGIERVSN
jgi:hypothetical protein